MEDSRIVELYWQKNADAIKETDSKYGAYCFAIADNILHNKEDSEECVNDTWLIFRSTVLTPALLKSVAVVRSCSFWMNLQSALPVSPMWRANTRPKSLASASGSLSVRCRSGMAMCSYAATSSPSLWRKLPSGTV